MPLLPTGRCDAGSFCEEETRLAIADRRLAAEGAPRRDLAGAASRSFGEAHARAARCAEAGWKIAPRCAGRDCAID